MSHSPNTGSLLGGRSPRQVVRLSPRIPQRLSLTRRMTNFVLKFGVALPITWVYKVLIGWWLDGFLARSSDKRLKEVVERDLRFLFSDFDGKFVPNTREEYYGRIVTLETRTLRFRVAWDRGEHIVSVSPLHAPEHWEDLVQVMMATGANRPIQSGSDIPKKPFFMGLSDLGQLLRSQFSQVEEALSTEHYAETIDAIDRIHQLGMQQLAESFNKSGGYFHADIIDPPWSKGNPN